jgi:hypothetical protein
MKITPENVSKAVNISMAKFEGFRKARSKFMHSMVGRFYSKSQPGDDDSRKASPLNLMYSAVTTLIPNLVYNDPRFKIRTDMLPYRQYGDILELAMNHLGKRIGLRDSLRKVLTDAIFMAGFVKTGLAQSQDMVTIDGDDIQIGQPYAERVSPDDMVLDPMARDWDEQTFIGNRFRVTLEDLQAQGLYDDDLLAKLSNSYDNMDVNEARGEKLVGDRSYLRFDELTRYVDLVEVYFPKERLVATLPYGKAAVQDKFLRIHEYEGPEKGPYHMLGFTYVPDNVLPVAPAGIWYDLHTLGNRIARKLSRQAERLKHVLAYQSSAVEDANAIAEADDGESVRVDDINAIKEVKYGGASDEAYSYMEWVKRQFSEQAGNLDLLAGTAAAAPTATQSEMLQANSSVRLSDMEHVVYGFVASIGDALKFYLHTDPLIQLPLARRVNGQDQQVVYSPEARQGDWLDFHTETEPYSMARQDPNMKVRRIMEFATNVIPAGAQAVQMLGPGFNLGAFIKLVAREIGLQDVDEIINDDALMAWMMTQMTLNTGDPGKAAGMIGGPQMGAAPGMNPGQPNPGQMGPSGGISPQQESNAAIQEGAPQPAGRGQPSANSLAQPRF